MASSGLWSFSRGSAQRRQEFVESALPTIAVSVVGTASSLPLTLADDERQRPSPQRAAASPAAVGGGATLLDAAMSETHSTVDADWLALRERWMKADLLRCDGDNDEADDAADWLGRASPATSPSPQPRPSSTSAAALAPGELDAGRSLSRGLEQEYHADVNVVDFKTLLARIEASCSPPPKQQQPPRPPTQDTAGSVSGATTAVRTAPSFYTVAAASLTPMRSPARAASPSASAPAVEVLTPQARRSLARTDANLREAITLSQQQQQHHQPPASSSFARTSVVAHAAEPAKRHAAKLQRERSQEATQQAHAATGALLRQTQAQRDAASRVVNAANSLRKQETRAALQSAAATAAATATASAGRPRQRPGTTAPAAAPRTSATAAATTASQRLYLQTRERDAARQELLRRHQDEREAKQRAEEEQAAAERARTARARQKAREAALHAFVRATPDAKILLAAPQTRNATENAPAAVAASAADDEANALLAMLLVAQRQMEEAEDAQRGRLEQDENEARFVMLQRQRGEELLLLQAYAAARQAQEAAVRAAREAEEAAEGAARQQKAEAFDRRRLLRGAFAAWRTERERRRNDEAAKEEEQLRAAVRARLLRAIESAF